MTKLVALLALGVGVGACSDRGGGGGGAAGAPPQVEPSVELGAPGGPDGLDFVALEPGAELRVQTFGQGGTHVLVAVRCLGFGHRAFVSATLTNSSTGVVVEEPEPARPQLLYCSDEVTCDLVPYLVHTSGLTETDAEKDGLRVELKASVRNDAGLASQVSQEVVLSTKEL